MCSRYGGRSLQSLALAVLAAVVITGEPPEAPAADRLRVVTSNTVIGDFVRNVAGDRASVQPLAPAGTDPHTFQPTPESMKTLSRAHIAFFNGSGLEEWWEKTVRSVGGKGLVVVELSAGLATRTTPGPGHPGHGHTPRQDPHVWLDPNLVQVYVEKIRDALTRLDAANSALFADRAQAYRSALNDLDGWIRTQVSTIPPARRAIVTFHNAFQYFAARYGLAVKGFVVASPGKEPSAKAMAELTRQIKREQIPAVFAEADFNAKVLETLAKEAGVQVVTTLYDGSLSSGPPADTYINMMRHNVSEMVRALR